MKPFNLLCALIGGFLFTGSYWIVGFDVPDHRGIDLWGYVVCSILFCLLGFCLSQFKDL